MTYTSSLPCTFTLTTHTPCRRHTHVHTYPTHRRVPPVDTPHTHTLHTQHTPLVHTLHTRTHTDTHPTDMHLPCTHTTHNRNTRTIRTPYTGRPRRKPSGTHHLPGSIGKISTSETSGVRSNDHTPPLKHPRHPEDVTDRPTPPPTGVGGREVGRAK